MARKNQVEIRLLIEQGGRLLLVENIDNPQASFYEWPSGFLQEGKTRQQAVQRILMETLNLSLKNVIKHLISKDALDCFLVEVYDPEDIVLKKHQSFGWVEPKEIFGYPIKDDLREISDLYLKIKGL